MNCQDITRILDEQDVQQLLTEELSGVQAHLSGCPVCARDWQVHAQLAGTEIPATPAELRAMFPLNRQGVAELHVRRRSRLILIGTIAAVAAAAAMLAVQLTPSRPESAQFDTDAKPSIHAEESTALLRGNQPDLPAIGEEPFVTGEDQVPEEGLDDRDLIRIVVMPPRHESTEAAAMPAIEAFHASLLQALRRSPDAVIEESDGAASPGDAPANRVSVVSPRVTKLSSGEHVYHSGDGTGFWSESASASGPQGWAVEVMLQPAIQMEPMSTSAVRLSIDSSGVPTGRNCISSGAAIHRGMARMPGGVPDFNALKALCSSVDSLATRLVDALKTPVEAGERTQLISRISNAAGPAFDSQRAFSELVNRSRQGALALDPAAIDAIAAYLHGLSADQRASSWIQLRGLNNPELVMPLLDTLRRDPEEQVRLAVLTVLRADYSADDRLRAAFEIVSREDSSELVRNVVRRTLIGEGQWEDYVVETLANGNLAARERLAPALYAALSADYKEGVEPLLFLGSEKVTRNLLEIFRALRAETAQSGPEGFPVAPGVQRPPQDGVLLEVMGLLSISNPEAAFDLQIRILTECPQPDSTLTLVALSKIMEMPEEPRVARLLENIAAGKAGPELQSAMERFIATRQAIPSVRGNSTTPLKR